MAGIGIGLIYLGYVGMLQGYIFFKGYNVTPKQLFARVWPPGTPDNKGTQTMGNAPTGA